MQDSVHVSTGSRLHFGLTSAGKRSPSSFGGMGVMVESPQTSVSISRSDRLIVRGCHRAKEFVNTWSKSNNMSEDLLRCRVNVDKSPPNHVGLGSGTQMALAVAVGLNHFFARCSEQPTLTASKMQRGARSAIGTFGFFEGGLIVDRNSQEKPNSVELAARTVVPDEWRVVLVRLRQRIGEYGSAEQAAFAKIGLNSDRHAQKMSDLIEHSVLPAASKHEFARFSKSIFEYGILSGDYYRTVQGGTFNGQTTESVIHCFRELGVEGVGQSSWGPTIFGWCENQDEAESVFASLDKRWANQADIWVTSARNQGASIKVPQRIVDIDNPLVSIK